jgi:AcrR family transcriptional regulator
VNVIYFVNVVNDGIDVRSVPLTPRRQRARDRRYERIVSTALAIVAEESLEALTMARLASELDVSAAALYRYFASKDELVVALQARTIARIGAGFASARARWSRDLPSAPRVSALCELVAIARFYLALAESDPRSFRLLATMLGDPRPLVEDVQAKRVVGPMSALIVSVSELFRAAAACGALARGNAVERTILLWIALHGVAISAKFDRLAQGEGWFDATSLSRELTRALLTGWGASQSTLKAARAWHDRRDDRVFAWQEGS